VGGEQARELGDQRNIANRGGGLRRHAPGRRVTVRPGKLRTHTDHAGREVDVVPDETEELRDPQAGVEDGRDHQPVARRAGGEQPLDPRGPSTRWRRRSGRVPLVGLEDLDRVGGDPAVAARKAHEALQGGQRAGRGLC